MGGRKRKRKREMAPRCQISAKKRDTGAPMASGSAAAAPSGAQLPGGAGVASLITFEIGAELNQLRVGK